MAKKSHKVKQQKIMQNFLMYKEGKASRPTSITKVYNRCQLCGRSNGYMRDFGICRVCFRHYARLGLIMGVKKASW